MENNIDRAIKVENGKKPGITWGKALTGIALIGGAVALTAVAAPAIGAVASSWGAAITPGTASFAGIEFLESPLQWASEAGSWLLNGAQEAGSKILGGLGGFSTSVGDFVNNTLGFSAVTDWAGSAFNSILQPVANALGSAANSISGLLGINEITTVTGETLSGVGEKVMTPYGLKDWVNGASMAEGLGISSGKIATLGGTALAAVGGKALQAYENRNYEDQTFIDQEREFLGKFTQREAERRGGTTRSDSFVDQVTQTQAPFPETALG